MMSGVSGSDVGGERRARGRRRAVARFGEKRLRRIRKQGACVSARTLLRMC